MTTPTCTATQEPGGTLANGTPVPAIVLAAPNGTQARVLALGATLHQFHTPDRHGALADIALGLDDAAAYEAHQCYLGVTVGRYANRIAGGRFVLDGQTHTIAPNNGPNALHGGADGFDQRLWQVASITSGDVASVTLTLASPDGDCGFPGALEARVTYAMDSAGALTITMEATTSAPTIVNMTNHALFNLAGDGSATGACGAVLTIPASHYLPVDQHLIPTGELRPVAGTVFDFRQGAVVGAGLRDGRDEQIVTGRGYDHTFVVDAGTTPTPKLVARLDEPSTGRSLQVLSTEPGVQLYTSNFLHGALPGKGGRLYRMGDGIALEPQKFPDTPNQPAFGSARLAPGETYRHVMVYQPGLA
jgi:aldose 1-epimerase